MTEPKGRLFPIVRAHQKCGWLTEKGCKEPKDIETAAERPHRSIFCQEQLKTSCHLFAMSRNNPNEGNFVISVAKPQLDASKRLSNSNSRQGRSTNGDLNDDYREYFRPRGGEFLTRGAQLASTQLVTTDVGSLASHLDAIGINGASAAQARNAALASAQLIDNNGGINTVSMSRLQVRRMWVHNAEACSCEGSQRL